MKRVVLIGNRMNVLDTLPEFKDLELIKVFVQKDSALSRRLDEQPLPDDMPVEYFSVADKQAILDKIVSMDFDVLLSNGCPLILPVSKMKKAHQLFINVHPTLLPDLKGKTPLSGVFMTHRTAIGATMHYIDDNIDTGFIIAQAAVELTPDIDQGLVYKISFDSEATAFREGMRAIINANYEYPGKPQVGEGSYFNRTEALQTIDITVDTTSLIMDKIKSFGIKGQGSLLQLQSERYRIYAAEPIVSTYLIERFTDVKPGIIALRYDDKFLLRTKDGLLKITDYEIVTADV